MFRWLKPPHKPNSAGSTMTEQPKEPALATSPREKLIAEALANARVAREAIGAEKLDKLRVLLEKKNQAATPAAAPVPVTESRSPMEQAKKILKQMDSAGLTDNMRAIRDQHK